MTIESVKHPFDSLVQRKDPQIRVAEAALWFACDHQRHVCVNHWLGWLDNLAGRIDALRAFSPIERVSALHAVLVDEERYRGDIENYYDPRNSFLNEVLHRRLGIPITLSVIWLDVCWQLGWPFHGVSLPGHFIIRCGVGTDEILIDPFCCGRILQRGDCERLVASYQGHHSRLTDQHFEPCSRKIILQRMLNNLRLIYLRQRSWDNAVRVLRRMIALQPDVPQLREELGCAERHAAELN